MSNSQEKIYHKLPYFFKVIALNFKGYLNHKKRYSKSFEGYLLEYNNLWEADAEVVEKYQKTKLISLLTEAYNYSKWYSDIFKDNNISLVEINKNPFAVLKKIPLLTKTNRKKQVESIINKNPKRTIAGVGFTSGTSGSPTKDYLDLESINRAFALWKRFHKSIGIKTKTKQIRFSGRLIVNPNTKKPPFWVYNYFEKQLLMSTYHLSDKNFIHYVNKIKKYKPELLDGYPSAIYLIARYINKNSIKLDFKPKAIAVTAETLYDYQRLEIEKAFNCKVYNQYASSEGSPFITECIKGNLHLNTDSGVFEFINMKGEMAMPGDIAQLVVTSFRNLKTPLIRYNIEDTILLPKKIINCSCGCNMPIIEKIIGREDDRLWTKEKGYVGRMDTAYKGLIGITKSQIIQTSPTNIVVNNIVDDNYSKVVEKNLIHNLKERLGHNINYKINIVKTIPLGANGKFDAVKREFKIDL